MPPLPSPYIRIRGLCYRREERFIFKDVDIDIAAGKITAIMGPSGSGKTSLLKLIGGQLKPDRGQIIIKDQDIGSLNHHQLNQFRRDLGMLFQNGALFSDLNVYDNVAFLLREHTDLNESAIRDLVFMKLQAVGLRGAESLPVHALSGGMARRVALARAIMLDPELMLYDEPLAGQDPINRGILLKLIQQLNQAFQLTSIIVSHDVADVVQIADDVYVIANGVVIGHGTPQAIQQSQDPLLKQFIHGLPDGPVPFQYPAKSYEEDLLLC